MQDLHKVSPEVAAVIEFLATIKPLNELSQEDLHWAAKNSTISYHRKGTGEQILDLDNPTLFIVRAGVFDVRSKDGELLDRVTPGGFFGFVSLLTGSSKGHTLSVHEDGLLYRLDKDTFRQLRTRCDAFDQFFNNAFEQRLRVGLRGRSENQAWATRIADMMAPHFYSVPQEASIRSTTQKMSALNIASIGIVNEAEELMGIFTDRDCRKRVLAEGIDANSPIEKVMTPNPITIDQNSFVHEANILMSRHQIKHLPITHESKTVGMVTLSDLIRLQRADPVLIISNIHRAATVEELTDISNSIPELLLHLIKIDIRADDLGRILTSVTSALTRRLIALAQEKYGPEPVPFVWMAFGSQGRQDQSAKSDQDNGLLLSDDVKPEHDEYFYKIAKFVNAGLDACGYVYCPGEIMAQTDKWRLPLAGWRDTFSKWILEPSSKALMHCSIFFDLRAIYTSPGAEGLFESLQDKIVEAADNTIFLGLLSKNALELTPPIGFLGQLIIDGKGEQRNTFDIKLRGMMPITDIARIHALANKIRAVNTNERITALMDAGAMVQRDGHNLLDALEYIAHQRLLHQGEQLSRGQSPDNHLNPAEFSVLTIRQLKDAFKVVRDSQQGLKLRYGQSWS